VEARADVRVREGKHGRNNAINRSNLTGGTKNHKGRLVNLGTNKGGSERRGKPGK